jgi:hypothetical protein
MPENKNYQTGMAYRIVVDILSATLHMGLMEEALAGKNLDDVVAVKKIIENSIIPLLAAESDKYKRLWLAK